MTTFDRQQHLIELLRSKPGIRVPEIARRLNVSEGTVRNDLRAMAKAGQLMRVRGGAVVDGAARDGSPEFAARARVQAEAKQRMAHCAARLVEDGDSLLFDASTTVFYLAGCLEERRNLTVITNGVEVARTLARNSTNTVILLGGVLRSDGTSVTGPISEHILKDFHVKTAFLSATGIVFERGLYEVDINEAQLKRRMIAAADTVAALVDSSKFGKVDLTPFAQLGQVSHLFVDDGLTPECAGALRKAGVRFTVCGDNRAPGLNATVDRLDLAGRTGQVL